MSIIDSPILEDEMSDLPPHPGRKMTEEEFVEWSGAFWAEWIDGEVIMMSVNRDHAVFQSFFSRLLGDFVELKDLGTVFTEPFQVRFGAERRRRMPDIYFIAKARTALIHRQEFEGAPDLIVEILSPESQSRDWREKYLEYQTVGVREYWIVDPVSGQIEASQLHEGKFSRIIPRDGKITSVVLPGFFLRPAWFDHGKLPKVHEALAELGI